WRVIGVPISQWEGLGSVHRILQEMLSNQPTRRRLELRQINPLSSSGLPSMNQRSHDCTGTNHTVRYIHLANPHRSTVPVVGSKSLHPTQRLDPPSVSGI